MMMTGMLLYFLAVVGIIKELSYKWSVYFSVWKWEQKLHSTLHIHFSPPLFNERKPASGILLWYTHTIVRLFKFNNNYLAPLLLSELFFPFLPLWRKLVVFDGDITVPAGLLGTSKRKWGNSTIQACLCSNNNSSSKSSKFDGKRMGENTCDSCQQLNKYSDAVLVVVVLEVAVVVFQSKRRTFK